MVSKLSLYLAMNRYAKALFCDCFAQYLFIKNKIVGLKIRWGMYDFHTFPLNILCVTALCEGCREKNARSSMLSQVTERVHGNMAPYLRIPYALPMASARMLVNR